MNRTHLEQLNLAKEEIHRFSRELDEQKSRKEITGLEYKIMMTEKLHGKEKDEVLKHIDRKIQDTQEKISTKRNKTIAIALTTLIILTAFAATLFTGEESATGYTIEFKECQSKDWQEHTLDSQNNTNKTTANQDCSSPVQTNKK